MAGAEPADGRRDVFGFADRRRRRHRAGRGQRASESLAAAFVRLAVASPGKNENCDGLSRSPRSHVSCA